MAYPTGDDLQAFLVTAGIIEAGSNEALDYSGYMDAATRQWEQDTGWTPFLGTVQTRKFDSFASRFLDLKSGLLSISTDGFTLDGRVLVEHVDYELCPNNAVQDGKPYTYIESWYPLFGTTPKCISLTGTFGYCSALPADVKSAILGLAAINIISTKGGVFGSIQQIHQDDVTIQYSSVTTTRAYLNSQQLQYQDIYDATVLRYKRKGLA